MTTISVVVPARNAAATLPHTLAALAAQRIDTTVDLVVVDDASTDATPALVEAAGARLVRQERSLGPAAARNAGVAVSAGDALAFTDADCRPAPDWLARGLAALSRADLVQGTVRPVPDAPLGPFDRTLWVTRATGLFESANLFVTRALFERVGGFPGGLAHEAGKEMGEDVAFGWAAVRAGARTAFAADAIVHHEVFARGARGFVAEYERRRFFPPLTRRVPELRDAFLYRRFFLNRRTAAFDLAVAGAATATVTRRPAALLAAAPYARLVRWQLRAEGGRVTAAHVAADAVGAAALLRGSLAARTPVL